MLIENKNRQTSRKGHNTGKGEYYIDIKLTEKKSREEIKQAAKGRKENNKKKIK